MPRAPAVPIALLLALTACRVGAVSLADASLTDGRRLRDLAGPADTVAILVYDPADCFSCDAALPDWVEYRRSHPARVRLALTREPSATEARQLTLYRIRVDGVLRGGAWSGADLPAELRFVRGQPSGGPRRPSRTPFREQDGAS